MIRKYTFSLFGALVLLAAVTVPMPGPAETTSESEEVRAAAQAPRFVAYYFHGNFRCATCRKLEAYSEEAIIKGFAKELESGLLVWRPVNTDEAENRHFVKDFELMTKAVVLVEYRDGEVARFSNLKLVWQLVSDKEGFLTYVREATREFLEQS
jgi:hypothetical protein